MLDKFKTTLLWTSGLLVSYFAVLSLLSYVPKLQALSTTVKSTTGGYGHSLIRFDEFKEVEEVNVIFLGSSHTYRGFDPRIFSEYGISSFNLGSSSQTPLNTYYLLDRYVDQVEVDLLVLETYWAVSADHKGVEATIDLASNMSLSSDNLKMALASGDYQAINSTLFNYVAQLVKPDQLDVSNQNDIPKNSYVDGGYVQSTRTYKADGGKTKPTSKKIKLADRQIEYMEKIVKLALANDANIMLVRTPVSKELLNSISNYQETTEPFNEIATKYDLEFIDFNSPEYQLQLGLNLEEHFYDLSHLNQKGVEIFNKHLAPQLVRILESNEAKL